MKTLSALFALVLAGSAAAQQSYPTRLVRLIVPYASGSSDVISRMLAPKLSESWKQPVIVDNRPGANAVIGTEAVAKAAPDGYTLLVALGTHVISPSLIKTPYDPIKDFTGVATLGAAELVLAVHPSLAAGNLQEFIALARSKPGEINYATTQIGGNQHLAGELFGILTGTRLTPIAYKGGGAAIGDVIGGHVQAYIGSAASVIPVIKGGKLRGLAVSGTARNAELPSLPTFTEAGVPNYEVRLWYAILAPAGTPREIVDRISGEINRVLAAPEFREALAKHSVDALISTPEQVNEMMKTDFARYAKVIKTANIKVEN
jgi:tripartite-type tricarboxylate transporter receptor subunit TctC